ncbi:hypothetical protein IGI04_006121 [Brassica rapa subsp. trilocularis]|uniref:UBX domain-containing protein n=1 Tax=Brassica rapa subsp. trilocularis TaxID=1813537 RepID=A0ABQ7NFY5_BRACM|nr:hypothetical protein IGI04_006121 [Brassica rapa subsp. trilocularis]
MINREAAIATTSTQPLLLKRITTKSTVRYRSMAKRSFAMLERQSLFENLSSFVDIPNTQNVVPRISVRLPDGRRVQRSFLKSESVQLLWSFCYSQIDQSERNKPFKLFQAIPGYYKNLSYGSYTSFEQSGLASSLVSVTWM